MSRAFNGGSSDYLESSGLSISDTPFTLSVWFKSFNPGSASDVPICIGESGTGNNWFLFRFNSSRNLQIEEKDTVASPTNSLQAVGNDFASWNLGTAVFASHSSRSIYLNGTGKATGGSARTASGFNVLRIGHSTAAVASNFNGRIAHAAVWNKALSDTEVGNLLYLFPNQVAVGNLVNYWPLTGNLSPEIDWGSGARNLTVNGTTFSTDNPNIAGTLVQTLMGASG